MTDKKIDSKKTETGGPRISRRGLFKGAGILAGGVAAGGLVTGVIPSPLTPRAASATDKPLKLGFQAHRTGIGAGYGRWYERTTKAAVKLINETGGIGGRPIELIIEDDGTDPKRGAEVVEKFANQHKVDFVFGTLFSHVVIGSAPRAGELKMPYFVVSETPAVPNGQFSRYVFQAGTSDVRSQMTAIAGWVLDTLGKKVTMIYPDYAFGYAHRDYFGAAVKANGGTISELIPIPPRESSFTKYFPRIPSDTDFLYHVMVGPGVLTFVRELGEHFGNNRPQIFGFIDSLEGVNMASPGLEFLEGTYFWEGFPRYADGLPTRAANFYREKVGMTDIGTYVEDPKDTAYASHMFGCWETLFAIKQTVEQSGYVDPTAKDKAAFIETLENTRWFNEGIEHPQGHKLFRGQTHQAHAQQFISQVANRRLKVVHRTSIEDSLYEPGYDYTKQPL